MIERLTRKDSTALIDLLEYVNGNEDYDFYFTHNNTRIYIRDVDSLKKFLKECVQAYIYMDKGDYKGIILVWKSVGADTQRYYVKLHALNPKIATDLLTILTWNFNKELFVKIRKDSKLVEAFKYKGFRFIGGRGIQMLLQRKPNPYELKTYQKEEDT